MISYVSGELTEIFEDMVCVECYGIGYNIAVAKTTLEKLPDIGDNIKLYTYLNVKEDAMNLFGFLNRNELDVFRLLLNVSGVGPKGALSILGALGFEGVCQAILSEDASAIKSAQGIGPKTAQRVIIDLKDKISASGYSLDSEGINPDSNRKPDKLSDDIIMIRNEAVEGLVALGFSQRDALTAVKEVDLSNCADAESLLKEALKLL